VEFYCGRSSNWKSTVHYRLQEDFFFPKTQSGSFEAKVMNAVGGGELCGDGQGSDENDGESHVIGMGGQGSTQADCLTAVSLSRW
jgi:hypothetical protein